MMTEPATPDEGGGGSWWRTLPGVLTALAGVLTAVTGLVVALGIGSNSNSNQAPVAASSPEKGGTSRPPTQSALTPGGTAGGTFRLTFPSGKEASLQATRGSGELIYTILDSSVKQRNPSELELQLRVRLTNNADVDQLFWNDSFRLSINGVPRAPTNYLNESVAARSADEGALVLSLPAAARQLVLLVGDSNPSQIPITIQKV